MEQWEKEKVAEALRKKTVNQPCQRCGKLNFDVIGFHSISLNPNAGTLVIGGPSVPVAIVACVNCGCITEHALGPLGLMNLVEKKS